MGSSESRRSRFRHAWFALALAALPASADTVRVYVTNSAGDSIHVIDPATNKVVQVIKGIEAAHGIGFAPDGRRVYVSDEADSTLDVVDRKTGKIVKKVPLSGHPNNIAVTKDGGRVVVGIADDPGALDVIDTASLKLAKSIPVNGRLHNVYVTPDNKFVVTGSIRTKVLTVIDLKTEQVAWELKLDEGVRPMTFEAGPDGSTRRIFVQLSKLNGFAVVDFAARKEVARVKLPDEPTGFGIAERRGDAPSHGMGVAPDGKTLWVTSIFANAVFAYSLPDLKLLGHAKLPELKLEGRAPIGAVPNWVTFTPDSKLLYISNAGARSVSVIDTKAIKLMATVPVGEVPKRINTLVMR
jgi:YVTN family beta-propeller protein